MKWFAFILVAFSANAQFNYQDTAFMSQGVNNPCASYDPSTVTGLKVWLKSDTQAYKDAGSTLAADGDTVQQWNDQSGSGNTVSQGTALRRPTFNTSIINGKPALTFGTSGALTFLDKSYSANLSQPSTIFCVFKTVTTPDPGYIYCSPSSTMNGLVYSSGKMVPTSNTGVGGINWNNNAWYYVTVLYNNASSTIRTNGVLGLTVSPGASSASGLRIGASNIPDQQGNFILTELLVYNANVSSTDVSAIECYLKTKYGL